MSDPANPKDWVEKAEEDYQLIVLSLRRKVPLTYGATFHAQQCAKKYLKGLLVLRGQTPPKIHDLVTLSNECLQAGFIIPVETRILQRLSTYASLARYPGNDPTVEAAKEAFEIAKAVRKYAKPLL
jgi:HEPN domain-containing protein